MDSISLKSQKKQRLIAFILVNAIQYPCTLKSNIYQSNKQWTPSFFHLHTNLVLGHVLIHSVDKIHVLVVTVELIWFLIFNIIYFIFAPTPNKFRRYKRFRKSYVKLPVVVLTYRTSYTVFLLDVRVLFTVVMFLFLQLFVANASSFA